MAAGARTAVSQGRHHPRRSWQQRLAPRNRSTLRLRWAIARRTALRSVVVQAPRDTRIVDEPEPALAAGRIKVRLRYSSVVMENVGLHTGTDPRLRRPGNPLYRGYPQAQAGEVIGEVVEVASD